ncbi:MAG: DUF4352 domain-containing protein, partial [Oscillospiraceae bacterium]|nr:DUF4352 domain-containing protein [Oscillospiraceae bacterium]
MKKKVLIALLALVLLVGLAACGNGNGNAPAQSGPTEVEAVLGQTVGLQTWDVTVNSVAFTNRVNVVAANRYFVASSGNFLVSVNMSATLTGDEAATFMPPSTPLQPAPTGSVGTSIAYDDTVIQRLILQGGAGVSNWTIANTEAEPGETIDGYILFEVPNEARDNTEAEFLLRVGQGGVEGIRLSMDLRAIPDPEPEPDVEIIPYAIGDTATFEQFEVTVTDFEITERFETRSFYFVPDDGYQFVVVHLEITNTGDENERVLGTVTTAFDTQAVIEHETGATFRLLNTSGRNLVGERIRAGETFEGFVIFQAENALAAAGGLTFSFSNAGTGSVVAYQLRAADGAAAPVSEESDQEMAEVLFGTWAWDVDGGYTYVFNADGTGTRGFAGDLETFEWHTAGDHLMIGNESWTFTIEGDTLTIDSRQV